MLKTLQIEWEHMTPGEKKKQLFLKQKNTLDMFLERNAISRAQYDKSLGDLIQKMGMQDIVVCVSEKGEAYGKNGKQA